jgi:hypothetical protein
MSIHVTANDLNPRRFFPEATGWHVDEEGRLHVTKTGAGNLATFHASAWRSVERVENAKTKDAK